MTDKEIILNLINDRMNDNLLRKKNASTLEDKDYHMGIYLELLDLMKSINSITD